MRHDVRVGIAVIGLLAASVAQATTWNEPWQKQVITEASSLGLFHVLEVKGSHAKLKTEKTLAGTALPETLELVGYYDLHVMSTSSAANESGLAMHSGEHVYLLPKQVDKSWKLPTPSSGIATVTPDGSVAATYRISFHQALQPSDAYERMQTCIFQRLHADTCNEAALSKDLDDPLRLPPVALSRSATKDEQKLFFAQHVALESVYLLKRDVPLKTLEPFLQSTFFHQQISAVRALAVSHDPGRNARLVAFVKDPSRLPMAQAMAVIMAKEIGDKTLIADLKALAPSASTSDSSLPLNIMDPRIGTAFPSSVRVAIEAL